MSQIPVYKFALREDIKEDKRFLPTRGEPKASGWDVRAAMPDRKPLVVNPFELVKIPLGVRGFCPDGWWYEIRPRSSSFTKKNLHALYGVVDETYEGELVFAARYIVPPTTTEVFTNVMGRTNVRDVSAAPLVIDFGDAIAQIIPVRREEMTVLEISNGEYNGDCINRSAARGAGGFGSTGK